MSDQEDQFKISVVKQLGKIEAMLDNIHNDITRAHARVGDLERKRESDRNEFFELRRSISNELTSIKVRMTIYSSGAAFLFSTAVSVITKVFL